MDFSSVYMVSSTNCFVSKGNCVRLENGARSISPDRLRKVLESFGYLPATPNFFERVQLEQGAKEVPPMLTTFTHCDGMRLISTRIEAPAPNRLKLEDQLCSIEKALAEMTASANAAVASMFTPSPCGETFLASVETATDLFRSEVARLAAAHSIKTDLSLITEITTIPFRKWVVSKNNPNEAFVLLPNAMRGIAVSTQCEPETKTQIRLYR